MNEDHVYENAEDPSPATDDGTPFEETEGWDKETSSVPTDAESLASACELSPDPRKDSDSDPASADQAGKGDGISELRDELNMLKRMIAAQGAWDARIHREYGEFRDLYPDVALDSLPDALWKEVGNGVPLAAAYALAERKRMYDEARALNDNRKNRERSSGALNASAEDVYSPSEVRAMTPSEVRKNFSKIMQSMQKWH